MKINNIPDIPGPASSQIDPTYVVELMNALDSALDYKTYSAGQRFTLSARESNQCYFIRSGAISLYREPGHILFELIEAPSMRGIIPIHQESYSMYIIRVIMDAEIAIISRERLYELLRELNLWESFSLHILKVASMMVEVVFKLSEPSTYEMVRYQLFDLMSKSEAIRESVSVEFYICSKTRLSRSSVMRMLSHFRAQGYIVMKNGILKQINIIPPKKKKHL